MMTETLMKMRRGFFPYTDGSGYSVTVTISVEHDTADPEIRIEGVGGFGADQWSDLKSGIDTMLKGIS